MERVWATPELRRLIFSFVRLAGDLISSALVRRSWTGDALEIRWRLHDIGMREVMGLLAPMEEEEGSDGYGEYIVVNKLTTPIEEFTAERWQTFLNNTKKVHVLSINTFLMHADSVDLVNKLVKKYGGPIFPNLREFEICSDKIIVPQVSLCIGEGPNKVASIDVNRLDPCTTEEGFEEIVREVSSKCPNLEYLRLETESDEFAPTYGSFTELRKLSLCDVLISSEAWASIAECTKLKELKLRSATFEDDSGEEFFDESLEFPALRKLKLAGIQNSTVTEALGATKMPQLQHLVVERVDFTDEEWSAVTDKLKENSPQLATIEFTRK